MNDYVSNSFKSKEEQQRKQEKVTTGKVKVSDGGFFYKALHYLISDDFSWKGLLDYILTDVIKPTIKKTALEIVKNGADMAINGKVSKSAGSNIAYNKQTVSYNSSSTLTVNKSQNSGIVKTVNVGFKPLMFYERGDAEVVLASMRDLVASEYGMVSVLDMYNYADVPCDYTWNKYGWTNLDEAEVVREQHGGEFVYMIKLPKATPLN